MAASASAPGPPAAGPGSRRSGPGRWRRRHVRRRARTRDRRSDRQSSGCSAAPGGRSCRRASPCGPRRGSTRWNSCGPSPSRTPVHSDVYGFMRSAVEERGSSCSITPRSSEARQIFSIPITVINVSGSVRAHAPVPLGLTTQIVPVSATPKLAPRDRDPRGEEALAQVAAGGLGQRLGSSLSPSVSGSFSRKSSRISARFAMDRRHQDVRGTIAGELVDQLRQVGLCDVDAALLECLVEADLIGRDRLDLDDLSAAGGSDEVTDDCGWPRHHRRPSGRGRPPRSPSAPMPPGARRGGAAPAP